MIKSEAKKNYFIPIEVFIIREAEKEFQSFCLLKQSFYLLKLGLNDIYTSKMQSLPESESS